MGRRQVCRAIEQAGFQRRLKVRWLAFEELAPPDGADELAVAGLDLSTDGDER